ncbi:flavin reductase family protein [Mycolicibacterium mengxianglii]|uniref:flavin reductase family protein n=1 Tax=Mycolicibacterium mengxianglii TaxID=2736649 RepID=UPI0018D00C01|nr:flavin reductase family protein [Mycolicibacterium mengxianglii]
MPQSGAQGFEQLVGLLDYPIFVVTTRFEETRAGCVVGFTSQTSINPPRFLVGLSKHNFTFRVAQNASHLAVHLLERRSLELAEMFGGQTGDDIDKFARCDWHDGPEGMPILDDASAWFVGAITKRFDVGDHVGHLLEPIAGNAPDELTDLVTFSDVRDIEAGHDA